MDAGHPGDSRISGTFSHSVRADTNAGDSLVLLVGLYLPLDGAGIKTEQASYRVTIGLAAAQVSAPMLAFSAVWNSFPGKQGK